MKYYIIAGEPSGDLHGANLIRALSEADKEMECRGYGGDLMQAEGMTLTKHIRDLAFMGIWEVIRNLSTILANLKLCKKDVIEYQPDVLVLIDYPGFNLKMATFAHKLGLKVCYYISPKVWAWNTKRALKIKRVVGKMLVILPFEKEFYKQFGYDVEFVGNPLLDKIKPEKISTLPESDSQKKRIALLPGSRTQEIEHILPVMLSVISRFTEYEFVLAATHALPTSLYESYIKDTPVRVEYDKTYEVVKSSYIAMVTSGTATLETAIIGTPQVVCYKTSGLTYAFGKWVIKVKYISLVNLILDTLLIKELIQKDLNTDTLHAEIVRLSQDQPRSEMIEGYEAMKNMLGREGASERAAKSIYAYAT